MCNRYWYTNIHPQSVLTARPNVGLMKVKSASGVSAKLMDVYMAHHNDSITQLDS